MIALTFLCGFVIEAVAVFWTHYAERGRGTRAALFSVLQASALLCLTDCTTWPLRVAFVAGYALGSVVAVRVKERFKRGPGPIGYAVLASARNGGVNLVHPEALKWIQPL
jgi:hypothetical protein